METIKNENEAPTNDLSISKSNEEIIQIWYTLQKVIKEKITLLGIINKQELSDKEFIFSKFEEHYKYKLEARQRTENLKFREQKVDINYNEISQVDSLNEITAPVKNFLFLIKTNYEYILKIVDLIDKDKLITEESKEGLAHLLCHQFYNNIQIPNPEQEELLVLCYHLLQKEINKLGIASVYDFLEEKCSFTGKFINCLMQKFEMKNFLSLCFGDFIRSIESDKNKFLDLNLTRISNYYKRAVNSTSYRNTISFDTLLDPMKPMDDFIKEKLNELTVRKIDIAYLGKRSSSLDSRNVLYNTQIEREEVAGIDDYNANISLETIKNANKMEKDRNMKEFYEKLRIEISENPKIYYNDRFKEYLKTFESCGNEILEKYTFCVTKVLDNIEKMIKMLSDKVTIIPYIIRCLAKIIYIFVSKRFPKITEYEKDGFIGKFFFEIYILPIIDNSYFNTEKTNTFLSNPTKNLINYIKKLISKLDSCSLFNQFIEPDCTVLNHYILKIIPFFHKFYLKLINVKLPHIIECFLAQDSEERKEPYPAYDYFNEHPSELFRYQCICFSMEDIKFLMELLRNHLNEFKGFTSYNSFEKAIQKIISGKTYLNYQPNKESKKFYMACKEEENFNKTSLKKKSLEQRDKIKEKNLLYLVKQSISKILKGLNMICSNEYTYFNTVCSTEDFFEALSYTLEDLNDLQDGDITKIPLSWYSTYLNANKIYLPSEYTDKDYNKLYQELLEEENKNLEDLKDYISQIFISSGMNLRFAEKFTENSKRELQKLILVERFKKIDDFMKKTSIEVCYTVNKKYTEEEPEAKIILRTSVNCVHYKFENLNKITDSRVLKNKQGSTRENHPKTIEDFIKRIKKDSSILQDDIISGCQKYKIYKTFSDYMGFVKAALKTDPNFSGANEDELQKILEIIRNHIIKKLYPHIFPLEPSEEDIKFYEKTKELENIEPEDLFIKDINKTEITSAVKYIKILEKSNSSIEKINCVLSILNTLNICIKFSTGKDEDGGADNLTPLLHYTIIKAAPERFYSNINFMKAFVSENENGVAPFTITQLEHAGQFISKLTLDSLAENEHTQMN